MQFPLTLLDLSLWLGTTSTLLLIHSQLLSAYEGRANIFIDQKKLENAAFFTGILFLVTIAVRIFSLITS